MVRRGPDSSRRFRPINTSREAPPAAGQAETREQADPRLLREIGSFRIQFSGALPAGTIVEVNFHGEAAAPASQTPRQQGGRRHRWRDIPAPRSDAPAGAEGNRIRWRDIPVPRTDPPAAERERQPRWRDLTAAAAPPTAEEQLLARHPEWEPLTPEDIRDRRDALDIFETLRLVPEESLQASRRNRGELVRQLGWAIGALHTRLAGTADDDPRKPALRTAFARLQEIDARMIDAKIARDAFHGDPGALRAIELRGNIRRRQREIREALQGLRLPVEITPQIRLD